QDDIIGGSSDLFTLTGGCTVANEANGPAGSCKRPDAPNMIFGGSGTDVARSDTGPAAAGAQAHDSDAIVANNGDVIRLVGTGGHGAAGFLRYAYDTYSTSEYIVPRAITLLDYTAGGPDYANLTTSCTSTAAPTACTSIVPGDIGTGPASWYTVPAVKSQAAGSEIHGENGDDFIYGATGHDVPFV